VADGIIGPPHPDLPSATLVSGTVLDPGEARRSPRVLQAIGPWRVMPWHTTYAQAGAAAVDALPGGAPWRAELEQDAPGGERHLLTFEGHVTHLTDRDVSLFEHMDVDQMVGEADEIGERARRLAAAGYCELIYTPSGPDVVRELRSFRSAVR
jgi:5,10-methylenetetrahydromethanopterin reductase